jgi:hypothetical protein
VSVTLYLHERKEVVLLQMREVRSSVPVFPGFFLLVGPLNSNNLPAAANRGSR